MVRVHRPPRDPSDDRNVALDSEQSRGLEWQRGGRRTRSSRREKQRAQDHSQNESSSLGRFIGHKVVTNQRSLPPDAPVDATSVACSALTTPSALLQGGGGSADSADETSHQPLIPRTKHNAQSSSGRKGRPKNEKRVGYNGNSSSTPRKSSALSMRTNHGKRPWFSSSSPSYGKTNNFSAGARSFSSTTGVQYRSATSTQQALEELKRKRLERQERRRAMSILVVLFVLAGTVHFAGQERDEMWSGLWGSANANDREKGTRGSRDKVDGATKDLGDGGEKMGTAEDVAMATDRAIAGGGAMQGLDEGTDEEYPLAAPVEKQYDPEHSFLLPLRHFADVSEPHRPSDTAFFFHVPRAGGSTVKDIIGKCLKLVQSSEVGVRDGHDADPKLQVLELHESRYVNVDTTTIPGIQRAVDLGLSSSGLANVVVSSYLHESAALFDLAHQGRAFILLRDPIERATSMYWHRVKEVGDLDASTTIEDYAQGNGIENNWMCRFLANRMTGELTKDDLEQAKEILKEKFLVGFLDDLEESVQRIMKFNGWKFSSDDTDKMREEDCIKDLTSEVGGSNVNPNEYEIPKRGSQAHALISWQTQFDAKLYSYAKELFDRQTKEWGTKERKKMLKKEKKKKGG
ncbi:hypothetical protein ACHAXT_001854 [Thalassiosira profunda]